MSSSLRDLLSSLRRPMAVYSEEGEGIRHATWLELFFDLVFIVAVSELGAFLREGLTFAGLLEYAALFVLVWWTWVGFSYYADVFDTNDLFSQLALLLVMFGVIVMSQTIGGALHGGSFAFTVAFLFLRLCYIGLIVRAWYIVAESRRFFAYWVTFSSLSTFVWALSVVNPVPGRYGLWISAFMLELAGIGIVYLVFDPIPVQVSHFPERLGLFTILVLGETMLAVAIGARGADWFLRSGMTAVGGFLVAVAVWWLYFTNFDERAIDRILSDDAPHWLHMRERLLVYVFGHYFVFMGVGAAGVGVEVAIETSIEGHALAPPARAALAGGIVAFLVGSSVCHRAMPRPLHRHLFLVRLAVAAVVVAGAVVGGGVAPVVVIWVIALLLVGLGGVERAHQTAYGRAADSESRA